ncbi:MAG TPA: hypothetical protein VGR26_14845 [Acidimicrobiales bacterium]|nr:hypothetical protein [Acidimicrobiales bacterium]
MGASIVVSCTVVTESQEHAARAGEAFSRAATGLALEGIAVSLTMGTPDDEEDGL